jgi:hypothetical protein
MSIHVATRARMYTAIVQHSEVDMTSLWTPSSRTLHALAHLHRLWTISALSFHPFMCGT